jgi:hypothetical protein
VQSVRPIGGIGRGHGGNGGHVDFSQLAVVVSGKTVVVLSLQMKLRQGFVVHGCRDGWHVSLLVHALSDSHEVGMHLPCGSTASPLPHFTPALVVV